jgi:hypothetical protein
MAPAAPPYVQTRTDVCYCSRNGGGDNVETIRSFAFGTLRRIIADAGLTVDQSNNLLK